MGLTEVVAAGSTISLNTGDGGERHEFVVLLIPEDETRSVDGLLHLSDPELTQVLGATPALVTIALPGTTDTPGPVVGDGTLAEPGRYVFVCTFPEGTTVEGVQNSQGPLSGENPHYVLGMVGELTVE